MCIRDRYAEKINGVVKPRVGLVNNGTEDTKGDPLRKEAYALLKLSLIHI